MRTLFWTTIIFVVAIIFTILGENDKMKKLVAIVLITILAAACFTGCTEGLGPGKFNFKGVHIITSDGDACLAITKWYESEVGIEVKTKDCGALWLSEGTYILYEDTCPICGR